MVRTLHVYLDGSNIGRFEQDESGNQSFRYEVDAIDGDDARPLSLSLPLRPEPFDDRATRAFFSGLLPDDELRRRLGQYLGVSANNEFALLAEVGRECAGAISIVPEDSSDIPGAGEATIRVLTPKELEAVIEELPRRPLYVGEELRLSLAGAQDKMAVRYEHGRVALPLGGAASTHILKTPIQHYESTVENEFFCMQLASRAGLDIPGVAVHAVGDKMVLLVERYDRAIEGEHVRRIHQEDACQAMGIPPSLKYQSEGGPSLPRVFTLLSDHALRPAVDRLSLLRWAVFNFLIGNADAHGKNVSLLHYAGGISLAPFYDLMSTLVYPSLSTKMAMKIGSSYRFEQVERRHWEAMARESELAPGLAVKMARDVAARLPKQSRDLANDEVFANCPIIASVCTGIEARAVSLLKKVAE